MPSVIESIYSAKTESFGVKIDTLVKAQKYGVLFVTKVFNEFFPLDSTLDALERKIVETIRADLIRKEIARIVPYFEHLEKLRFYKKNSDLQAKLLNISRRGLGQLVKVTPDEKMTFKAFDEHLDQLLRNQAFVFELMRGQIYNFERLEVREDFLMNQDLQNKVFQASYYGSGTHINVDAENLVAHVKDVLAGATKPINPWLM